MRCYSVHASALIACTVFAAVALCPLPAGAAAEIEEEVVVEENSMGSALRIAGLGIAAAIAIGMAGFATAKVQAAVGSGATGALAEKPELFTSLFFLYAIPETIVILGFVIAILLIGKV